MVLIRLLPVNILFFASSFNRKRESWITAPSINEKCRLRKMGWSVIIVWKCQLEPMVRQQTLMEIEYYINHTYLE